MSESPRLPPETFALGRIASLLVMLGAVLYFTGWTYRWIYFGFFQLEVTTLPLPLESFYIAAFQVFFGSFRAILHTIITLAVMLVGVYCSLWLLEGQPFQGLQAGMQKIYQRTLNCLNRGLRRASFKNKLYKFYLVLFLGNTFRQKWFKFFLYYFLVRNLSPKPLWKCGLFGLYRGLLQLVKSFLEFHLLEYQSLRFLRSLLDETVIICWLLAGCFWLAQWQGEADAWRDAVNETSSLPVVTIVVREDSFPLGVNPDNIRNPQGIRIIGDASSYQQLLSEAINNPSQNRVWRLLIDVDGDYYIFPALPERDETRRPPVVVIPRSREGDRLIQLRPTQETDIPTGDNNDS